MFFPRLRRHAKWVFLFLAIAFGLGFIGFGVGAGGVGIGDVFRGQGGGSGIPSVSDAQKRVNENPKDAKAFHDLATALRAEAKTAEAAEALENYIALRPKDADALQELAILYLTQAEDAGRRYQLIQLRAAYLGATGAALQGINLDGRPLDLDRISSAVASTTSDDSNLAAADAQEAGQNLVSTYQRIAAADPDDITIQLRIADAAQNVGDIPTAIAAFERYLDSPLVSDSDKRKVRRLLNQLRAQAPG
jgi:tetratricopeptide (TPR) repeat protein